MKTFRNLIAGVDHGAGFAASKLAQDHSDMLKEMHNMLYKELVR